MLKSYTTTLSKKFMDQSKVLIIGLSGTNGSGKDTVGEILQDNYSFCFISVTDLLRQEAQKRHLSVDRHVLREISAEWRRLDGLGVLVDRAYEDFKSKQQDYKGLVISSLRNPGEADRIHQLNGLVIWIDADPKVRYRRVQDNKNLRNRFEEDNKSFEQFLADEASEMHSSGDNATLNMAAVKKLADIKINNNFDTITAFSEYLDNKLAKYL
jgi:dephospho-CoA kinase